MQKKKKKRAFRSQKPLEMHEKKTKRWLKSISNRINKTPNRLLLNSLEKSQLLWFWSEIYIQENVQRKPDIITKRGL